MIKFSIVFLVLLLTACASPVIEYQTIELQRPARPVLPVLSADKAKAINDETWSILVIRQRMLRQYAEQLEVIIDATGRDKK